MAGELGVSGNLINILWDKAEGTYNITVFATETATSCISETETISVQVLGQSSVLFAVADNAQTCSDLDENIRGALCYILGFISGIFFLLTEKKNKFVRFHAMQSTITFGALFLISFIPIFGWILSVFIAPFSLLFGLFLMYQAYQGEKFKLPVIGDLAEKQVEKFNK